MLRKWWQSPQLISARSKDRKISWLEVFSDLIYVIIFHSLTVGLMRETSILNTGKFLLLYLLIYWTWSEFNFYFDSHGDTSLRTTTLSVLQMAAIALATVYIPAFYESHFTSFILAFALNQLMITYLWWGSGHFDPQHYQYAHDHNRQYWIALGLELVAVVVPNQQIQILLLILAIVLNYSAGWFARKAAKAEFEQRHLEFTISPALSERYSQLMMIVMGESLAGLIDSMSEVNKTWETLLLFFVSAFLTLLIYLLFYINFDHLIPKNGYGWMYLYRESFIVIILNAVLEILFIHQMLFDPSKTTQLMLAITTVIMVLIMVLLPIWMGAGRKPDCWIWETGVKVAGLALILLALLVSFTWSIILITVGMGAIVAVEAIYQIDLNN
ncbi:low temperature requirement protein A [Pediococcus argentinicus]|uniref:Low temperature requirement protein LtrA n=1 Tax=Pediococcus argentinicus TaxID=480391 RepID=A0A0R2NJU7_9LACO|nr:low temperature requirement protein A [Pediococcus argentinicus]KRO26041.1 hypothetical protein IV88_GL000955 [Pediococcus argentinicus]NKZ21702.1 low temperature requirement protein A [Pediococcus argentinicus]GEP18864.1 hypothetical protein LSA03_02480 [Pediococcus argentinicus]